MSTMLIDDIAANLNRTQIDCWFNEGRSTTVIDIVGNGKLIHTVTIGSKLFAETL